MRVDALVIGGGFYGCCLAIFLRRRFKRVLVVDRAERLLTRASRVNQARLPILAGSRPALLAGLDPGGMNLDLGWRVGAVSALRQELLSAPGPARLVIVAR